MYGYGYRYNSGLVVGAGGGAPFVNTYSLDFDGVDDYVDCGDSDTFSFGNGLTDSPFSISAWINMDDASAFRIANKYTNTDREYIFSTDSSDRLSFALYDLSSGGRIQRKYNTALTSFQGQWINVVATYNGNSLSSGILIYLNGTRVDDLDGNLGSYTAMENTTQPFEIGRNNLTSFANGKIDELSVFDKVLTPTEITSISAAPTDLTDLSPIAWYRMGDNGSYKSPQWLLPNNENKDKVSNYSLDFDGVDDNIFCGIDASRQVQTLTMSVWVKPTAFARDGIVLNGHVSYGNQGIEIYWNFNQFGVRINGSTYGLGSGNGQNNWSHILVAYDGNTLKRMTNGVPLADVVIGATINYTNYNGLTIGRSPYGFHIGNIDEFAFWNSDQSANFSTIYGTGAPNDLTDLSPIAWYRMGEEATFSGGVWTVPDQVGSNDGTSNAMTIEDRVGEAPSSENNALSYNMDLVDRVTDVPT